VTKAPTALKKTASKSKPDWKGVMDDEPLRQSAGEAKWFCQKFEVSIDPYGDNIFPEACGISAGAAAVPAASRSPRCSSSGSICGSERSCGLDSQVRKVGGFTGAGGASGTVCALCENHRQPESLQHIHCDLLPLCVSAACPQ
jgi:hypothetical protein